jgi:glycosyltransferase involved in cell wall biosynthesis
MEPIRILQEVVLMNPGGVENLLMNLYRNMDREKVQFDFLVHRPQSGLYEEEIKDLGGKIYRTPSFSPFHYNSYKKEIIKVFKDHPEYKVLHAHADLNGWPVKFAAKCGVPVRIAHSHNSKTSFNLKYLFMKYQQKWIKDYTTHMFMCSTPAGVWSYGSEAVNSGKVLFVKNGIDTDKFKYNKEVRNIVRTELGAENKIIFGHIGRFTEQKNHRFIVEIFNEIHKKNSNTLLVLCGEGRLMNEVKNQVKQLDLQESVKFLGVRKDPERIYQAFDLFLFPSLWEGLPLTGIEAQTSGLPVLMSDVITDETIVTNNVKKYSLQSSPADWADAALAMVKDKERKDCSAVVKKAGFDIKATAAWLQDFYIKCYNQAK